MGTRWAQFGHGHISQIESMQIGKNKKTPQSL